MTSIIKHCYIFFLVSLLILSTCSTHEKSLPILLLATESEFGTYTGEILHAEGYIVLDTLSDIGYRLNKQAIQFHGKSEKYNLNTGKKMAPIK